MTPPPQEEIIQISYGGTSLPISYRYRKHSEKAIIYIHGLGNTKDDFPKLWGFLEEKNYSILMYDLVGFGKSSKKKDFSYTIHDQAEVLNKIMKKLKIKQAHLIGYSMGGAIALRFNQNYPEKVLSFINLEGNLTSNDAEVSRIISLQKWDEFELTGYENLTSNEWACTPYSLYNSSVSLVKDSDSGVLLEEFMKMNKDKWYLFGEKNHSGVSQTFMKIKNVQRIMIPNSGHKFRKDNPEEICKRISEIIQ